MKHIRKFVQRLRAPSSRDRFAEEISVALGGLSDRTKVFAEEVRKFGIDEQIKDLLIRIERLENELHPLRNGQPVQRPTYRD